MRGDFKRFLPLLLCVALALTLVPVLTIGFFDRPSADDLAYGWRARQAFVQTGSVTETLRAATRVVSDNYATWQGTFSAVFLFSLQPAVWGEGVYAVTPFVMLGLLLFATLFLLRTLLRDWRYTLIVGVAALFLSIQYVPSAVEGFFWYNGAVFYTFFYALSLLGLAGQIRLYRSAATGAAFWGKTALLTVLSFLIGGGNYVTALLGVLTTLVLLAFCVVFRKSGRHKAAFCLLAAASLAGLLVSLAAPGNAARQLFFARPTVWEALLSSFGQAASDLLGWLTPPVVCALALLLPVLYALAAKTAYSFRFPLLISLGSFCLFAAQNMPPLYAMGIPGPDRLRNIVYFSYIWLLLGNAFYWAGWTARRRASRASAPVFPGGRLKPAVLLCVLLLGAGSLGASLVQTTSYLCACDLLRGDAARRLSEYNERLVILNDKTVEHAALRPYSITPQSIAFPGDYQTTDEASLNAAGALYYGKQSVVLTSDRLEAAHIARPGRLEVTVDGRPTEVPLVLIDQGASNYASLPALAAALADSPRRFRFAEENGAVRIYPGEAYDGQPSAVAADGDALPLTAWVYDTELRAYRVGGESFVKLRDMAQALDVALVYNRVLNRIELDTTRGYTAED